VAGAKGGNKRNAIPREAWADFYLNSDQFEAFKAFTQQAFEKIQFEYQAVEKEAGFSLEKSLGEKGTALTPLSQKTLINLLFGLPHGVLAMHPEITDLVETSTNLAIIHTHSEQAEIICSSRSSVASALEAARQLIEAVCELAGAKVNQPEGYPGWTPNLESPLLKTLKEVYRQIFEKEPKVEGKILEIFNGSPQKTGLRKKLSDPAQFAKLREA